MQSICPVPLLNLSIWSSEVLAQLWLHGLNQRPVSPANQRAPGQRPDRREVGFDGPADQPRDRPENAAEGDDEAGQEQHKANADTDAKLDQTQDDDRPYMPAQHVP